jgi:hypothetical protein
VVIVIHIGRLLPLDNPAGAIVWVDSDEHHATVLTVPVFPTLESHPTVPLRHPTSLN